MVHKNQRNKQATNKTQEPEAKGQVVGRMGVGVTSRGAGGLDTAQPVGKAIGCASHPLPTCTSLGAATLAAVWRCGLVKAGGTETAA